MVNNPILTIIILNYNSGQYLSNCLASVDNSATKHQLRVLVVDNCSQDDSFQQSRKLRLNNPNIIYRFVKTPKNLGFAAGNNYALTTLKTISDYVLFLNPDTLVNSDTFTKSLTFALSHPQVDALTCQVILAKNGLLQPECHRGFPTPWRAFCYFSGLTKLFPTSSMFAGYFLGNLDLTTTHPIEACVGAFLLIKSKVGSQLNWWNEKYYFYGEDLDFCYRLHLHHFRLFYYPKTSIIHYQGISSGIKSQSQKLSSATRQTKTTIARASTQAMRFFYEDYYLTNANIITKFLIGQSINCLEIIRVFKAKYL